VRRLVWVDIQQDRDFKRVDGRYDWREGTAFSAADIVPPLRRTRAFTASSNFYANPSGTLSVSNNTNSGVYCSGCTAPVSGTTNSSTYAVPLAVAGSAVQCFDSGTNGSDPQGFANYDAAGNPQPYPPDTTVTQTIAADYTLAWAGNQQTASSAGLISGSIKIGLQVIKTVKTGFPSPGAVITGIVGIFEYFLENSCKESGNYFNVTSAATNGAAASSTINTNLGFAVAGPTGSTPPGLQLNPSALKLNGSHLWLNNEIVADEGLSDYSCIGCGNTNAIDLNWDNFNPCHYKPVAECSLQPSQTPTVTSGTGNVNCGPANAKCPFPAADWPATNGRQQIYAGMSGGSTGVLWSCDPFYQSNCGSLYLDSGNNVSALAYNGSNAIFMGDSNADLYACSPSISGACNETGTTGSHDQITALAYSAANSIFAAIYNTGGINAGQLWVCNPVLSGSAHCTQTYEFGNGVKISDLVSLSPYVFAAGSNGSIYQCSLSSLTCGATFTFSKGVGVESLTTAYGQLWAGLSNGQLWTCNPTGTSCSPWDTLSTGAAITSLAPGPNHTVYVGAPVSNSPTQVGIWQCGTGGANDCTGVTTTSTVSALTYANNYLYYGTTDGAYIYQCIPNPSAVAPCTQLDSGSESSQYIGAMVAAPPAPPAPKPSVPPG
jgi:hypothetical protein